MADPIADSKTNVSGSASAADIAGAYSQGAAAANQTDSRNSYQADLASVSGRVADFVKDTGTDERYQLETADRSGMTWLNAKRTYDLHQTWDYDALNDKRKHQAKLDSAEVLHQSKLNSMEVQSAEERLTHQAKLNSNEILALERSRRHNDDMHTVRFMGAMGFGMDAVIEAIRDSESHICDRIDDAKA